MVVHSCVQVDEDACAVCGELTTLWQVSVVDPQTHETFSVRRCPRCGLGRTRPQPDDLGSYYGNKYYGDRHGLTEGFCNWRRCRLLQRAATHSGRLLDVGSGDGAFMAAASRHGWEVVGVEIGPAAAASTAGPVVAELSALPCHVRFEAITLWHSLEHFANPRAVVRQLRHHLADDGILVVAVPDAGGVQAALFGRSWFHLDVPRHLHHFTRLSLETLLTSEGFVVRQWRHQELEYDVFGWVQSALNRIGRTPNGLFASLTRKHHEASRFEIVSGYFLAAALVPGAVTATLITAALGRGGTLIAIAGKGDEPVTSTGS
jgi:SAM-dependent methyltransferase